MINSEKIQINGSEGLKKLLSGYGLGSIEIPKFDQIIELTQSELNELKEKLMKKTLEGVSLKDAVSQIIKEKLDGTRKTVESTVTSITGQETAILKEKVSKGENHIASQIEAIKSIDVNKRISEISPDTLSTYDAGLVLLIQQLANSGVKKTDLAHSSKFRELIQDKSLDPTMKQIADKTIDILDSQNDLLVRHVASSWTKTVDMAYKNAPSIKEASDYMSLGKMIPEGNFIGDFANKYPKSFSLLAVSGALLSLGFIGKMLFGGGDKNNNKEGGKESGGFFSKLFDKFKWGLLGGAGIFGILGLGKMVGIDQIKEYVKKNLGIDVDENRLLKAMESYKKGEYMDMIKILIFGNEKLEKAKESEEFYKNVSSDMHDKGYTKDLRNWQETKYIKEYAGGTTTNFLTGVGSWIDGFVSFFGEDTEAFLHTKALRKYIEKETKRLNIEIKKDDKVEGTLKMIIEKNKSQPIDEGTTDKKKVETNSNTTSTVPGVIGGVVAGIEGNGSDLDVDPTKKDGADEKSLGNAVLYYWVKGKRLKIGKIQIQSGIRNYIEQLEGNIKGLPQTRQEVRDMKNIDSLLTKKSLTEADKKVLAGLLDKHITKFVNLPGLHISANTEEYVKLLEQNPKLKNELLVEKEKVKQAAEKHHDEVNKLLKEKYDKIKKGETTLKRIADKGGFNISDYIKFHSPLTAQTTDGIKLQNPLEFTTNQFEGYSTKHKEIINEIAGIDQKINELYEKQGKTLGDSTERINKLIESNHIKPERSIIIKEGFFKGLEKVGYTINKLPGAGIGRLGFRLGFTSIIAGTITDERASGETIKGEKIYKKDLKEAGLGLLPISSEYVDFKAAITGKDFAGRDLGTKDRLIRGSFGVVGTVADLASIITLGQSEWLRVWLAGAKGTTRIAELAGKMGGMDKFSKALFEFSRGEKFIGLDKSEKLLKYIKNTHKVGRIVNYSALGIATYQVAHETHLADFKPDGKIYNSGKAVINKVKTDGLTWD